MTVSLWRDARNLEVVCDVDVAIVGGGVTGFAIARQCCLHGVACAVIEARDVASGASGRNAGFLMTGLADAYETLVETHGRDVARAIWQTSQANLGEVTTDVLDSDAAKAEVDLVACGSVVASWTDVEAERLARSAVLLQQDGFDVVLLDPSDVRHRLHSGRFRNGIAVARDCGIHPVRLVRRLSAWARAHGTSVLEHHEVRCIEHSPEGGWAVVTSNGVVRAPRVVIATNAYAPLLDPYFAGKVRPIRGQVLAMRGRPGFLPTLVYTDDGYQYARQLSDGTLVAGGSRRGFAEREVGYGDETSAGVQHGIEAFVCDAWPEAAGWEVTHRWSGVMGFSNDGLPMVGVLPHRPTIAYAVGFTGHGLGFAFAAARALWGVLSGDHDAGIFTPRETQSMLDGPS